MVSESPYTLVLTPIKYTQQVAKKITAKEQNNQLPAEIRNKITFPNEQDKYKLVDARDFEIELLESEEAKAQFLRTLDKWLAENQ